MAHHREGHPSVARLTGPALALYPLVLGTLTAAVTIDTHVGVPLPILLDQPWDIVARLVTAWAPSSLTYALAPSLLATLILVEWGAESGHLDPVPQPTAAARSSALKVFLSFGIAVSLCAFWIQRDWLPAANRTWFQLAQQIRLSRIHAPLVSYLEPPGPRELSWATLKAQRHALEPIPPASAPLQEHDLEYHKRLSLSVLPVLFALLAFRLAPSLTASTSMPFLLTVVGSLPLGASWLWGSVYTNAAHSVPAGVLSPAQAAWLPNFLFGIIVSAAFLVPLQQDRNLKAARGHPTPRWTNLFKWVVGAALATLLVVAAATATVELGLLRPSIAVVSWLIALSLVGVMLQPHARRRYAGWVVGVAGVGWVLFHLTKPVFLPEDPTAGGWRTRGVAAALQDSDPEVRRVALSTDPIMSNVRGVPISIVQRSLFVTWTARAALRLLVSESITPSKEAESQLRALMNESWAEPDDVCAALALLGRMGRARQNDLATLRGAPAAFCSPDLYAEVAAATKGVPGGGAALVGEDITPLRFVILRKLGLATLADAEGLFARFEATPRAPLQAFADGLAALGVASDRHVAFLLGKAADPLDLRLAAQIFRLRPEAVAAVLSRLPSSFEGDQVAGVTSLLGAMPRVRLSQAIITALRRRLHENDPAGVPDSRRVLAAGLLSLQGVLTSDDLDSLRGTIDREPHSCEALRLLALLGPSALPLAPTIEQQLRGECTCEATEFLAAVGAGNAELAAPIGRILLSNEKRVDSALWALKALGPFARSQHQELLRYLNSNWPLPPDRQARFFAALDAMGPLAPESALLLANPLYSYPDSRALLRAWAHYVTGGESARLLEWLAKPRIRPVLPKLPDEAADLMRAFYRAWLFTERAPDVRKDVAEQIGMLAEGVRWNRDDLALLAEIAKELRHADSPSARAVESAVGGTPKESNWLVSLLLSGVALHGLMWVGILASYPRSVVVQSLVWNSTVRRILGLLYITPALLVVPWVRRRLLEPFREALRSGAGEHPAWYYAESDIVDAGTGERRRLMDALSSGEGLAVLEGESGFGKTLCLRQLAAEAKDIVVFLEAKDCREGPLEAARRLIPLGADPELLDALVHTASMSIFIDGLNEAEAPAREAIRAFLARTRNCRVIVSTQPILWNPPPWAQVLRIQPLSTEAAVEFLVLAARGMGMSASDEVAFGERCRLVVEAATKTTNTVGGHVEATLVANPLDLTILADLLLRGEAPLLSRLLWQQYELMAEDYRRVNQGMSFPLDRIAERAYQARLSGSALSSEGIERELAVLASHRFVVRKGNGDATDWLFRHERILDFFVMQTFLPGGVTDRRDQHLGDLRFRGVFLQLAMWLPIHDAVTLERTVVLHAAETRDHALSDEFVQIVSGRLGSVSPGSPGPTAR